MKCMLLDNHYDMLVRFINIFLSINWTLFHPDYIIHTVDTSETHSVYKLLQLEYMMHAALHNLVKYDTRQNHLQLVIDNFSLSYFDSI